MALTDEEKAALLGLLLSTPEGTLRLADSMVGREHSSRWGYRVRAIPLRVKRAARKIRDRALGWYYHLCLMRVLNHAVRESEEH